MFLYRRKKFISIVAAAAATFALWVFYKCLWLPMATKTNQTVELTSLLTSCQQQFNNEFNIPIGTDFPMPTSAFHKGNILTMIFSIQNFQFDDFLPERVRNYKSPIISNAQDWFFTNTWTIEYLLENEQSEQAICTPIKPGNVIPLVLIVTCNINPILQT